MKDFSNYTVASDPETVLKKYLTQFHDNFAYTQNWHGICNKQYSFSLVS